ncbi:MAG TPA: histidine kinase [Haloplasmataceae bacterium]
MRKIIDKCIIFVFTLVLFIPKVNNIYMIAPVLLVIILSALLTYYENDNIATIVFIIYLVICFFLNDLSYFIPLISYDVMKKKIIDIWNVSFMVPIIHNEWIIVCFIPIVYILKYRTISLINLEQDYYYLRDTAQEIALQLKRQNHELINKQDYEINLATVTERNRIARDIHDNVGHLLSRSILQLGALLTINKDEEVNNHLLNIKDSLSEAMKAIRDSVHNLYEKAIDLRTEIEKMVNNFSYCPINLYYDIEHELDKNVKYCFITVTKEALANIVKHSNATHVTITIREHPALYQLIIADNGTNGKYHEENGIGIKNIIERVNALKGNVHITTDTGFRIFISIPKNERNE